MSGGAITLLELNRRIASSLAVNPALCDVWVAAETADLRTSGGHCYMELIQKDDGGSTLARSRAVIWASAYARLSAKFTRATGAALRSDMKVMVRVAVNFHAVYGLSLVINDIDPDYTLGDLARRRREIIERLRREGVYDLNRSLPMAPAPSRIAIVSARGAAGYGDFVRQLHGNAMRLRFSTTLFEAVMQGERTPASVIAALEKIMERIDEFDCVAIIRGGGAVADLASFDDYDLAFNVAQFPLPVVVGIGHDRDACVLDFVAHTSVKTPTAAAEALVGLMASAYGRVHDIGAAILDTVRDTVGAQSRQLAYLSGLIPALALNVVARSRSRLDALAELLDTLSPEATLRRGYSITRIGGVAITDSTALKKGDTLTSTFATGPAIASSVE